MKYLLVLVSVIFCSLAQAINEYTSAPLQVNEVSLGYKNGQFIFTVKNGSVLPALLCGIESGAKNNGQQIIALPEKVNVNALLPVVLPKNTGAKSVPGIFIKTPE